MSAGGTEIAFEVPFWAFLDEYAGACALYVVRQAN
jgi:hypothetical protein